MKPLAEFLSEQGEATIQTLARYIGQSLEEHWQPVLHQRRHELEQLFAQAGEPAYSTYAAALCRPIQTQLTQAGFLANPRFPGRLAASMEWGPIEERERWMWCVVRPTEEAPIGALVLQLYHDHTQFRIPHPPGVLALEETETPGIVAALVQLKGEEE